ncbi:MAG TPA: XdhC family protein [Rhodocyclaceae bacterium]|nr:XdhC family protein [Rhodocyclaceae bacterium]
MGELETIVRAARRAVQEGEAPVLATVVAVAGSAYRRPGARLLITGEGWRAGSVSGGCLEKDIVTRGPWLAANGPLTLTYDTTDDEESAYGLGCRGVIRILLERLETGGAVDLLAFLEEGLARRRPGVVATLVAVAAPGHRVGQRLLWAGGWAVAHDLPAAATLDACAALAGEVEAAGASAIRRLPVAGGEVELFAEYVAVPPSLVVFGAGHDAVPLVRFAKALGFHVTVVDGRPGQVTAARFPLADRLQVCRPEAVGDAVAITAETLAVVMTHSLAADRQIVAALLPSPARYIGVLGPRKRSEELLAELDAGPGALGRLYAPVGLDLGAEGPEAVALSIMAEIEAVVAGRPTGHLRDRAGPIHG